MDDVTAEWDAFRRERNAALRTLDLNWARAMAPPGATEEALRIGLHKARYHCVDIEPALRIESAEWLRARGLHDLGGGAILPPGQLPPGV